MDERQEIHHIRLRMEVVGESGFVHARISEMKEAGISTSGNQGQILQPEKSKSMQNPVRRALIQRCLYLDEKSEFHTEALFFFNAVCWYKFF